MSILSIASTFAIVLGLASTVPQIATMLRTRSAHGQSPLGWTLGLSVNVLMGYVNIAGFHAPLLGVGNLAGAALNAVALTCVMRLAVSVVDAVDVADAVDAVDATASSMTNARPLVAFEELPTAEFHVIKSQIDAEHARREHQLCAQAA